MTPNEMLMEFNALFGIEERDTPGVVDEDTTLLRINLLREEVSEHVQAVLMGDLVEAADGLADIVYIAYGTARVMGLPLDDVLAEVHRTNMAKAVDGVVFRRGDGKVLKPEGWTPPDIAGVLREAGA